MSALPSTAGVPERFVVEKNIGAGGFGTVFVVRDSERGEQVALKRLERVDPASVYRFKQEFRALADVVHPRLVRLHELFALDQGWCFTMDFIDGIRFDSFVRGLSRDEAEPFSTQSTQSNASNEVDDAPPVPSTPDVQESGVVSAPRSRRGRPFHEERLRGTLKQLVEGVLALHSAGILHRDLKPSNVLVDREGKLSILDFGMAMTGLLDAPGDSTTAGTPAYMSPEQARGAPLTMASDWYAVGLMLYEVLSGHLPFSGTVADMLTARTTRRARDPRATTRGLPDDLCDLAMALLSTDPAERPTGHQIAQRVGLQCDAFESPRSVLGGTFVGRKQELASLHAAFEQTKAGRTVVAHVHGVSGVGKTTAIRRFLTDLALHDEVVTLEGRCYERETVPFKAMDDLVDALGRYLSRLRPVEAAGFMPRDARALVRLFPSLGRLEFMTSLPGRAPSNDPHELRRRAFGALREIFARITDTRPLVLFIDDVHWGDADSAALVRNLLAPPDVPPLLLIVGYRGEDSDENELLRTLRNPAAVDSAWETVDVPVGQLSSEEAEELVRALLGNVPGVSSLASAIAEESAQSPLFVAELVRSISTGQDGKASVSMRRVVEERVTQLPPHMKLVVEVLACSDRPLTEGALRLAAELQPGQLMTAVDRLRDDHLIQLGVGRGRATFEIFHDKIRRAVHATLSEGVLAEHHGRLARAHEANPEPDPEVLARHHLAAGDTQRAVYWMERAGDRAAEAVASDHAVALYQRALTHGDESNRWRVMAKLADSLTAAGRGAEAAEFYLALAGKEDTPGGADILRTKAAEQFLRAGHVEESLAIFRPIMERAGLALPRTPTAALVSLLWTRTRLKWRGVKFEEKAPGEIPEERLRLIDMCWGLGSGLSGIDVVRAAHYHSSNLWLALDAGEPFRVSRALSVEVALKSLESADGVEAAREFLEPAAALAERLDDKRALAAVALARAVMAWARTDLSGCASLCEKAVAINRDCSESAFREIGSLEVWFLLHSLFLLGRLDRLAERAPAIAREAEARGDRYTLSTVRAYNLPLLWAARGRPDQARREANAAIDVWPEGTWYHQHWAHLRAHCFLDLYEGDGATVLARVREARPRMKRSLQLRIRTPRLEFTYLEGRGALEAGLAEPRSRELRSIVRDKIRRLHAERSGLATVYAMALEAGLAVLEHPDERAAAAFETAQAAFEKLDMPMHVAAAELRAAECRGGAEAIRRRTGAFEALEGFGVADPSPFADMLLPRVIAT